MVKMFFLKLASLRESWNLLKIIKQTVPVGISSQTKLNLHFLQHSIAFTSCNEVTKHVLNGKVLGTVFGSNQRDVCDTLSTRQCEENGASVKGEPGKHSRPHLTMQKLTSSQKVTPFS